MPKCYVAYGDYLTLLVAITQMRVIVFWPDNSDVRNSIFYAFIGSTGMNNDITFWNNSSKFTVMK